MSESSHLLQNVMGTLRIKFPIKQRTKDMGKTNKDNRDREQRIRNPIAVAMGKRYGNTGTIMRDRRERRPKDRRQRDRDFQEDA